MPALPSRRYWNLLREVVVFQYKLKDQNTFFGYVWSFLHPLAMLGVLFLFFNARAGQGIDHYAVYLLIALVHFAHFSGSTNGAMMILYNLRALTCNTTFPKEILVIGSVLSKTPEFAISLGICVGVAGLTGVRPGWTLALLPVILLLQVLVVMWVSLLLSATYVFVKDTAYVYQVFLRILFLITPIFYAADFVGHGLARRLVALSPLAQLIEYSRAAILGSGAAPGYMLGAAVCANALLIAVALVFFKRLEPRFAEYV